MELRLPALHEETEFRRAVAAVPADNPTFLHFHRPGMTLADYLDALREQVLGIDPAPGREVASTFLFAFVDGRIVGRASIRHTLEHPAGQMTGHIGYAVLPESRGRGHATEILRLAIRHAREHLGISRVLVTCDPGNAASVRVIEKNGGVFEDQRHDAETGMRKRRYWIDALPYD
ncbi:MAG: GNAT family N-acetyltransferase [Xanthomonadales bacterium]|nr:GNAT family N-acetyltransferase [Xanthomonadales bacterium]